MALTPNINRHRRSVEIEVMPCTDYYFKVIASEDWKGLREDFKVFSEVVPFINQYTPKFLNPPLVKERGRRRERPHRPRGGRDVIDGAVGAGEEAAPPPTAEPETFTIKVGWRLSDLDYPICLDYFVLDYYDTMYNESSFSRQFQRPFLKPRFELEVPSSQVPCEPDYQFIIYAFGFNKKSSTSVWTPPSCIVTTPAPTTTTEAAASVSAGVEVTTESWADKMEVVEAENERLKAKITGLKQEYEKIGLQVFLAFQDNFFSGLEDFLARRRSGGGKNGAGKGNSTEPMFT